MRVSSAIPREMSSFYIGPLEVNTSGVSPEHACFNDKRPEPHVLSKENTDSPAFFITIMRYDCQFLVGSNRLRHLITTVSKWELVVAVLAKTRT